MAVIEERLQICPIDDHLCSLWQYHFCLAPADWVHPARLWFPTPDMSAPAGTDLSMINSIRIDNTILLKSIDYLQRYLRVLTQCYLDFEG
jgi:hypothetical protein